MSDQNPMRDVWREGSAVAGCRLCGQPLPSPKARYCSRACQQRAYRLRHTPAPRLDGPAFRRELSRRQLLAASTLYECPSCQERFLGQRRCPDCHRFCRALGLAARCPDCEMPILLNDLFPQEVWA
jgi:hypothetical protein